MVSQIHGKLLIRDSRKSSIRFLRKIAVLQLILEGEVGFRSEIKASIFRWVHICISLWAPWLSSHCSQWKLSQQVLESCPAYTMVDTPVGFRSLTELSKDFGGALTLCLDSTEQWDPFRCCATLICIIQTSQKPEMAVDAYIYTTESLLYICSAEYPWKSPRCEDLCQWIIGWLQLELTGKFLMSRVDFDVLWLKCRWEKQWQRCSSGAPECSGFPALSCRQCCQENKLV